MMQFKGYKAHVEPDPDTGYFHGSVVNITDTITFEGRDAAELQRAFADSVEDYQAFCREVGREPEQPPTESVNLAVDPDTWQWASTAAHRMGVEPRQWIIDTIVNTASGIILADRSPAVRSSGGQGPDPKELRKRAAGK